MSFELRGRKHFEDELAKIVRKELGKTAQALTTSDSSQFPNAIHDARKRVKKVRAVVALFREADAKLPRRDRKRLKSVARALSRIRDSHAIIETFDRLRRRYPKQLSEHTYGILRRGLVAARNGREASARRDGVFAEAVDRLKKTRRSAQGWKSPSIKPTDLIMLVTASYRRSRRAMKRARNSRRSATLHGWRKELKALWYQLRLVKPLITPVAPLVAKLKRLETALGDNHNLVVLAATLRACPDLRSMKAQIRQIDRLAARSRQPLRKRAFALGQKLHVRKPKAFAGWLRAAFKPAPARRAAA